MDSLDYAEGTQPHENPRLFWSIALEAAWESLWVIARALYEFLCSFASLFLILVVQVTPFWIVIYLYSTYMPNVVAEVHWTILVIPVLIATYITRSLFTTLLGYLHSFAEQRWGRAYSRRIPRWMVSKQILDTTRDLKSSFSSVGVFFRKVSRLVRQPWSRSKSRNQLPKAICQTCNNLKGRVNSWDDVKISYSDLPRSRQSCVICATMLAATRHFYPPTNTSSAFFHHWRRSWEDDEVFLVWNKQNKTVTVELGHHSDIWPRFTFYCLTKGPDMPLISSPRAIVDDTRSEASMHRVFSWILACTTEHEHCGKNEPKPLPDRVFDLGDSHGSPIKLIDSHNQLGYYACLSHCWGPVQPLRTLSGNKIAFMAGIPMAALPKTFQDAVTVCRQLNIRYFWVDSLCIVQDSIDEWQTQSSKMATIYENAFITIAATKAKGHEEGLHHSKEMEMYIDCIPASEIGHGISEDVYVRLNYDSRGGIKHWDIPDFGQSQDQEWPLLTRAWVFQERLLSPRMLHFAKSELVWECRTGAFCDCGRRLTDASKEMPDMEFRRLVSSQSIKTSDVTPAQLRALWYAIVERYSRLMGNLTHEGDVFPALSGLATRISGLLGDEYVAGIWRSNMVEGLLWTYDSNNERPQPYRIRLSPKSWRAPTWSWASMTDAISYQNHSKFQWTRGYLQEVYARVINVECNPTGSQKTGPISSAALTLSGWTSSATIRIKRSSWGWECSSGEASFGLYCTLDRDPPYGSSLFIDHPEDLVDGTRATCLRLARIANEDWYLVLVKESPSSNSFRRVGLFKGPDITWQWTSSESWRRRAKQRYHEEKRVMRIV